MTTPKKHIDFAKDNLAHIAATKNDVKNENEVKDEDGEWYRRRSGPKLFEILCICFFMKYMTLGSNTILETFYENFIY